MENNMDNQGNANWTSPSVNTNQQPVPNSMGAFVLGIVSICTSIILCCCYGYIIGLITSIIGLVLANGAMKAYNQNPDAYTEASFRKAKNGRLISIIGLILSLIIILLVIVAVVLQATGNMPEGFEQYQKYNRGF
jgi:SNF family Na+-dependent transporter